MITSKTTIGVSIGSVLALASTIWLFTGKAHGYITAIEANTVAISLLATSVELARIGDDIGDIKKEIRELKRDLRHDPDNDLIIDQIEDLEDELEELEKLYSCLAAGNKVCK
jgi:uncharacterized membrane protein YgaE (UPF0421/DUF939 family)